MAAYEHWCQRCWAAWDKSRSAAVRLSLDNVLHRHHGASGCWDESRMSAPGRSSRAQSSFALWSGVTKRSASLGPPRFQPTLEWRQTSQIMSVSKPLIPVAVLSKRAETYGTHGERWRLTS
jgi:hypothetical protein